MDIPQPAQLPFPLDPRNAASILSGLFALGTVTLVGGTASVASSRIKSTSIPLLTYKSVGGTQGNLRASVSSGTLTITSSSGADTSDVYYLVVY